MKRPETVFSASSLATRLRDVLHVPAHATLHLAFSGGLDSTVLLHALASLRRDYPLSVNAIHIDHGLHPDSSGWAEHCRSFCQSLEIPSQIERVQVDPTQGDGLESAARRARYAAIARLIPAGASLVTAHQADDQAETVLLQLLRGAGVAGLAAMAGERRVGSLRLLRPLLNVPRSVLEEYAHQHNLGWIEDPSNRDDRLRRNFLRTAIFPQLETRWPGVRLNLTRTAQHAAEAQELLDEVAARDLVTCSAGEGLSVSALITLTAARQRNLMRYWLRSRNFPAPDSRKLEEIEALVHTATRSQRACVRSGAWEVWRYREVLMAIPSEPVPPNTLDLAWNPLEPVEIEGMGRLHTEPATGQGVATKLLRGTALHIRQRRGGEQLSLSGRAHHHRLKKLLQEAGVPPWERARLPLLFLDSRLVAVADRWVSREYAAGANEPGLRIVWTPFPGRPNRF